nr:jasmonic acid-amido synthetase JAR1-like [Ipomoea batatas]
MMHIQQKEGSSCSSIRGRVNENPFTLTTSPNRDVVKVKGFHNSTPDRAARGTFLLLYVHQHRQSHGEGSPIISEAAAKILADSKLEVVDFTSHANTSTDPGNYTCHLLGGEPGSKR